MILSKQGNVRVLCFNRQEQQFSRASGARNRFKQEVDMTINKELMLNRRIVQNHREMRRLATDAQTVGFLKLLKEIKKIWDRVTEGVLYHKCW